MKKNLHFKVSAKLSKLLGQQSVSSKYVALSELIKNAYDADAKTVGIVFNNVKLPGGTIEIIDNGEGMSLDEFESNWLTVATSVKERIPVTDSGRRKVGAKGIGRFSVEKLGTRTRIISVKNGAKISAKVDWNEFKNELEIGEISIAVDEEQTDEPDGTRIIIDDAREQWLAKDIEKTKSIVSALISPFLKESFSMNLVCPEFPELEGTITNKLLEDYFIEITAKVGFKGEAIEYTLVSKEGKTVHDSYPLDGPNSIGPVKFCIYYYSLDKSVKQYYQMGLKEINRALDEHAGIKVYQDGIRVYPYGGPDDSGQINDWLGQTQLRLQRFGDLYPGVAQTIGVIEISQENNPELIQKTTREGLIENKAFFQLKYLIDCCLRTIAGYMKERRKSPEAVEPAKQLEKAEAMLKRITDAAPETKPLARQIQQTLEKQKDEIEEQKQQSSMYRNLASLGLVAAEGAHEMAPYIVGIRDGLANIEDYLKEPKAESKQGCIDDCEKCKDRLNRITEYLKLVKSYSLQKSRETGETGVEGAIKEAKSLFSRPIRNSKIEVRYALEITKLRISPINLESILINLFSNAIYFLRLKDTPREILIETRRERGQTILYFSDNGLGIPEGYNKKIFKPFVSTKKSEIEGTGLGLTIVSEILAELGGTISVADSKLGGATFRIVFPGELAI